MVGDRPDLAASRIKIDATAMNVPSVVSLAGQRPPSGRKTASRESKKLTFR